MNRPAKRPPPSRTKYTYEPIGNREYATDANQSPPTMYFENDLNQYTGTAYPYESFDYDGDGDMVEDGAFEYTWNCENRLVKVEPKSPADDDLRLSFTYDYMGRRVQKVVEKYESSAWSTNAVTKFVWDLSAVPTAQAGGWLLVADPPSPCVASEDSRLDGLDSDALVRTYTWGLDLSGTFQGAGGIGGLLMVDDTAGDGFCGFYTYDGNPAEGGMCQVIDAEDDSIAAHYPVIPPRGWETGLREYDPYGREIAATGAYASSNPWRFSTKYLDPLDAGDPGDPDASLLYYGYRYLSPRLGRWMSRDPKTQPSLHLYVSFQNRPTSIPDRDGRDNYCPPDQILCCGVCQNSCDIAACVIPRPPPPAGECRLEICCHQAYVVASHCHIRLVDDSGDVRRCSARQSVGGAHDHCDQCCNGLPLVTCCTGDSRRQGACRELFHDLSPSRYEQDCYVIGTSSALCDEWECLRGRMREIHESCYVYGPVRGPNSNSAVWDSLYACGIHTWDVSDPRHWQPGGRFIDPKARRCPLR